MLSRHGTVTARGFIGGAVSFLAAAQLAAQAPSLRPYTWIGSDFSVYTPFTDARARGLPESEVQYSGFVGGVGLPMIFGQGRTMVIAEAVYRMRRFHPSGLPSDHGTPAELHEVNLDITVRNAIGRRWALILQVSPGLASDFIGSDAVRDGLRYHGAAIVSRFFSQRLTLGLGAAYGNTFSTDFPIPLLMLDWNDGGRWRISGALPGDLGGWYQAGSVELGLHAGFDGSHYTTNTLFPAGEPRLQYLSVRGGPSMRWTINAHLALTLEGGATWQRVRLYDGNTELADSNYDLRPTFYSDTKLRVTF